MPTPPPTKKDLEHAALILDHIQQLRDLGAFVEENTRQSEIHFISLMLRNERLGLSD
jgi:hypothetical protein